MTSPLLTRRSAGPIVARLSLITALFTALFTALLMGVALIGVALVAESPTAAATKTAAKASNQAKLAPQVRELLVAAASDLRPAFEEIGKQFTAQTGTNVTFSFGSSGQLAQQISNGAPFDVFASADANFVEQVLRDGIGDVSTKTTYALGQLALWFPPRLKKQIITVTDLSKASIQRIAIANPEHAPYGRAAVQVLQSAKIYELVKDKLVLGENVSDTYRLATSGNADAALVSLSLVIANTNTSGNNNKSRSAVGHYIVVPRNAHAPLQQTLMVTATKSRSSSAKAFASMVSSAKGRTTMRKYGFLLPGDPQPSNNNG